MGNGLFEISSRRSNKLHVVRLEGDGKGNWSNSGKRVEQFEGGINIDISLTSLTNTFHQQTYLNRKRGSGNTSHLFRRFAQQISQLRQQYIRLSSTV